MITEEVVSIGEVDPSLVVVGDPGRELQVTRVGRPVVELGDHLVRPLIVHTDVPHPAVSDVDKGPPG